MFFRYALVGAANFFVATGIMVGLGMLGVHYVIYTFIAYCTAIGNSYLLNARYTFGVPFSGVQVKRFFLMSFILLGLIECLQLVLIELINVRELFAIASGMVIYSLTGYALSRLWVFTP